MVGGFKKYTFRSIGAADRAKSQRSARTQKIQNARRGGVTYGTVARTRGVYGMPGETKYFDSELDPHAVDAIIGTWGAACMRDPDTYPVVGIDTLFCPKDGSAINERIGRQVYVTKIKIKGRIYIPPQSAQSTGDVSTEVRVLLVQDTQTNASQMTANQLMQGVNNSANGINAFQNLSNFGRFRVLKDKRWVMDNPNLVNDTGTTGGIVQNALVKPWKWTVVFRKPVSVRFNGTNAGTIADIIDNSFHIVAGCNNASTAPNIAYYCRVCYVE